jgi:hypothetical protein
MTKIAASLLIATALLHVTDARAQGAVMSPLTTFGTNGWLAPGAIPQLGTANNERGLAFNPVTGNNYDVREEVLAGYAMGTVKWDWGSAIGGVRVECDDLLIADHNGLVVVPRDYIQSIWKHIQAQA